MASASSLSLSSSLLGSTRDSEDAYTSLGTEATEQQQSHKPDVSAFVRQHAKRLVCMSLLLIVIIVCFSVGVHQWTSRPTKAKPAPPPPAFASSSSAAPPPFTMNCSAGETPASCLRALLPQYGLDAYIIPSADSVRKQYVSGFNGSGDAVLIAQAGVKSRIFPPATQYPWARQLLNLSEWEYNNSASPSTSAGWLAANLPSGAVVGIDPNVVSASAFRSMQTLLDRAGISLSTVRRNLVDEVWGGAKPPTPSGAPVFVLGLQYTGESALSKMDRIRQAIRAQGCVAIYMTTLDDIAWTVNMRGDDIPYTPVFTSSLLIAQETAYLFIEPNKTASAEVTAYLASIPIQVHHPSAVANVLRTLNASLAPDARLWLTGILTQAMSEAVSPDVTYTGIGYPVTYMKALKNTVEMAGMRAAHLRDSAIFVQFFDWLETEVLQHQRPVDECSASDKILEMRRQLPLFVELSYPTIAGSGPNGAIIHYFPQRPDCAAVDAHHTLVLDSGAQYLDGTTDTTRTIHLGNGTLFERHTFTRVLQGAIDQMDSFWLNGAVPTDFLARQPLLRDGLTYGHGNQPRAGRDAVSARAHRRPLGGQHRHVGRARVLSLRRQQQRARAPVPRL